MFLDFSSLYTTHTLTLYYRFGWLSSIHAFGLKSVAHWNVPSFAEFTVPSLDGWFSLSVFQAEINSPSEYTFLCWIRYTKFGFCFCSCSEAELLAHWSIPSFTGFAGIFFVMTFRRNSVVHGVYFLSTPIVYHIFFCFAIGRLFKVYNYFLFNW